MKKQRDPMKKFIKNKWTALNIRCGKYKHLQTKNKCKVYENIKIEFTREQFKEWCVKQKEYIFSLERPSLDRKDSCRNYTLDNIQIIELKENIAKKRQHNGYLNGPKSDIPRGIRNCGNRYTARITIKRKEKHLGSFKTKEEAYEKFKEAYFEYYGKLPF